MAYAAVLSLKQTIQRLLNSSDQTSINIVSWSKEILEYAYQEAKSLQEVLERLDSSSCSCSRKRLNALDGQIREAVHKLEDVLEFHESESHHDMEEVRQEISSFVEIVKKMEEEYIKELDNPEEEKDDYDDDDDEASVSSSIDDHLDDGDDQIVGLADDFTKIKDKVLKLTRPVDFGVFSIVGKTGSGRTTVGANIFKHLCLSNKQLFACSAWVSVGPAYQFEDILARILSQIDKDILELHISGGDDAICDYLYTSLKGRKYMIVLDDVRDARVWDYLRRSFPEENNGSLVLLTTELMEVALSANSFYIYEMAVLSEDYIWDALLHAIFGLKPRLPELEETGKKIAKNCRGLRFVLVKVMLFLLKAEKTPECWNKLATDEENPIFMVDEEISEICKINEDITQYNSLHQDAGRTNLPSDIVDTLSNLSREIRLNMFPVRLSLNMEIISFLGMAGIGKTILVKKIFEDQLVLCHFDHRVWITLGPKYHSDEILVDILAQIHPSIDKMQVKGDGKLVKDLLAQLSNKRCLIVLDDVWNMKLFDYLSTLFQETKGKVLVTTRLLEIANVGIKYGTKAEQFDNVHKMCLLNKEESWCLLRQKVFGKESCPPELEKAGKRISENCEGLPLTIVTVASILSKAEKTQEFWDKVAKEENLVFMKVYSKISKVLLPSYEYIPQYLKSCFLYMGVFLRSSEIRTSKLINLWNAEGFLEPNLSQTIEDFATECLSELANRSLVLVCQKGSNFGVKTCCLHSVFWHLCNSEAVKNKFFHSFNTYADNSVEGIKSQRRLCIRNGMLFSIKDVHNLMKSISVARSLICPGPNHPYPVPIYFGLRLLRVLDAVAIRFYEFPVDIVKLIHLRYLGLTCNGKLPASISKLWNLEYLIVSRHLSIKSSKDSLCLPVEIWDLKKLKHLQIMGSCLPNPNDGALLPNLQTLLDVTADSCTERVLKRVPNLKKLRIQIELAPDDDDEAFCCLESIYLLLGLKCVVVNAMLRSKVFTLPISPFMRGLKKLSLAGLRYPWRSMIVIGELQNLEVLKLRCYAFQGPKWNTSTHSFKKLKFLSIEDTDLVCWKCRIPGMPALEYLSIKHCYTLEELPSTLTGTIRTIEIVDCNPLVGIWAKQMKEIQRRPGIKSFQVDVHSSWDVGNINNRQFDFKR